MTADLFGETHRDENCQDILLRVTGSPNAVAAAVVAINQIDGVSRTSFSEVDG
ncbi:hypothetical protein [Arthrobacter sp. 24S4-2]|uniref:hypothetical protein n=1 Tax=Arthrobacter sp. 24S4-2 TaxID=2575374 RepID=UPI0020C782EB|nr:hypothetical protein [Arthrobacter sp. 24S4-2]